MKLPLRLRACLWHLAFSAMLALACAGVVFGVWYPNPLQTAAGVTSIFLIVLGVDVVLGPAMTLVVYDPRKKELRRDLAVILALQLAALGYGLHTVFVARPVYLVFSVDRFEMVFANDLTREKMAAVKNPTFQAVPLTRPEVIAVERPADAKARSDIMLQAALGGDDVAQLPQFYVPYETQRSVAGARAKPLSELAPFNAQRRVKFDALVRKYADRPKPVGFLPVRGKVVDVTAILSAEGDVLEVVGLQPWQ